MEVKDFIHQTVTEHPVVLFMKGTAQFPQCGFSGRAIQILKANGVKTNWPTIPQLYVKGEFLGGSDIMGEMHENGELKKILDDSGATS